MSELVKSNRRNRFGVKASSELYRTFRGEHYICWLSYPDPARIAAYRAAGLRCRRLGEELFLHHMDTDEALRVDREAEGRKASS